MKPQAPVPDLPTILDAIREKPDDGPRWLALAGWLLDDPREGAGTGMFATPVGSAVAVAGTSPLLGLLTRTTAHGTGRGSRRRGARP